jgi:hypothetical protein
MISIISAVIILVCGQLILRVFVEPIFEQRRIIGKILYNLCRYPSTPDSYLTQRGIPQQPEPQELEQLAGELIVTVNIIPLYRFFTALHITLSKDRVSRIGLALLQWRSAAAFKNSKDAAVIRMQQESTKQLRELLFVRDWMEHFDQYELMSAAGLILQPPIEDSKS